MRNDSYGIRTNHPLLLILLLNDVLLQTAPNVQGSETNRQTHYETNDIPIQCHCPHHGESNTHSFQQKKGYKGSKV